MNLHGFVPQGPVVILGSGDIGLIMASQIAAMGISVTLVEQKENCGGLARNRRCLKDNSIRLICSQTIDAVEGSPALTGCCLNASDCRGTCPGAWAAGGIGNAVLASDVRQLQHGVPHGRGRDSRRKKSGHCRISKDTR